MQEASGSHSSTHSSQMRVDARQEIARARQEQTGTLGFAGAKARYLKLVAKEQRAEPPVMQQARVTAQAAVRPMADARNTSQDSSPRLQPPPKQGERSSESISPRSKLERLATPKADPEVGNDIDAGKLVRNKSGEAIGYRTEGGRVRKLQTDNQGDKYIKFKPNGKRHYAPGQGPVNRANAELRQLKPKPKKSTQAAPQQSPKSTSQARLGNRKPEVVDMGSSKTEGSAEQIRQPKLASRQTEFTELSSKEQGPVVSTTPPNLERSDSITLVAQLASRPAVAVNLDDGSVEVDPADDFGQLNAAQHAPHMEEMEAVPQHMEQMEEVPLGEADELIMEEGPAVQQPETQPDPLPTRREGWKANRQRASAQRALTDVRAQLAGNHDAAGLDNAVGSAINQCRISSGRLKELGAELLVLVRDNKNTLPQEAQERLTGTAQLLMMGGAVAWGRNGTIKSFDMQQAGRLRGHSTLQLCARMNQRLQAGGLQARGIQRAVRTWIGEQANFPQAAPAIVKKIMQSFANKVANQESWQSFIGSDEGKAQILNPSVQRRFSTIQNQFREADENSRNALTSITQTLQSANIPVPRALEQIQGWVGEIDGKLDALSSAYQDNGIEAMAQYEGYLAYPIGGMPADARPIQEAEREVTGQYNKIGAHLNDTGVSRVRTAVANHALRLATEVPDEWADAFQGWLRGHIGDEFFPGGHTQEMKLPEFREFVENMSADSVNRLYEQFQRERKPTIGELLGSPNQVQALSQAVGNVKADLEQRMKIKLTSEQNENWVAFVQEEMGGDEALAQTLIDGIGAEPNSIVEHGGRFRKFLSENPGEGKTWKAQYADDNWTALESVTNADRLLQKGDKVEVNDNSKRDLRALRTVTENDEFNIALDARQGIHPALADLDLRTDAQIARAAQKASE